MTSGIVSWFGLGNPKIPKVTKQDRAILDMKNQRDKLRQYQRRVQILLDQEAEQAKECLKKGDKERARRALRRKKYQESLLSQTDSQLDQLEQLVSSIEFSLIEVSVMHGLKQGNQVLAEIHSQMSIENVEKLMSDTREAIAYQQEIDEMLSSKMSLQEEEDVMKELAMLQEEVLGVKINLPDVPKEVLLPNVPTADPVQEPVGAREETRVALEA